MSKTVTFLITIVLIGGFFRLFFLASVPPSPSLDEVSIGYNAFSILQTGRDEYGSFFPLLLRAYDDWRPALYVYTVIPFVLLFDLTVFAVRLPSAILSIVSILATFFIVKTLFPKKILFGRVNMTNEAIALLSSFLVAISPWHIYISRLGHEVNLGLSILLFSILLILQAIQARRPFLLYLASLFFGLSFHTYQSEKVVVPILLLGILLLFYQKLLLYGKNLFFAGGLFLLLFIPALTISFNEEGMTRFRATSVFAQQALLAEAASERLEASRRGDIVGQLYNNYRLVPVRIFVSQYVSHFDPLWLTMSAVREDHKAPYQGLLYFFEAIFLVLGVIILLGSSIPMRAKLFLFLWFLSGPVPAALTTGAPHAMRSFTLIPVLQMLAAIGIVGMFVLFRYRVLQVVFVIALSASMLVSVFFFVKHYFILFPKLHGDSFQKSLSDTMKLLPDYDDAYDQVFISNEGQLYQSYMFYLFHTKYDPVQYLENGGTGSGGFAETHVIGKYHFRPILFEDDLGRGRKRVLYIGNPSDFPEVASIEKVRDVFGEEKIIFVSDGR